MTIYLSLIWEFIKTGLFAIGGGLAALPFITDIGQRTGWYTTSDIANMIAVAESCPGPLGVNMATFTNDNAWASSTNSNSNELQRTFNYDS